jgi:hypothetical protein
LGKVVLPETRKGTCALSEIMLASIKEYYWV